MSKIWNAFRELALTMRHLVTSGEFRRFPQYRERWLANPELRGDINFLRWGVKTEDITGSHCGLCGRWTEKDPGDPAFPADWRWGICAPCTGEAAVAA